MTLRVPVTGQGDLFLNPVELPGRGTMIERSRFYKNIHVELLGEPSWDSKAGMWVALANVGGCLCLVEVSVTAEVSG